MKINRYLNRQPEESIRFRCNIGPLPAGCRMWADEYIAGIDKMLESQEQFIEEQWRELRAEIAPYKGERKRGRPRKRPLPS